MSISPSDKIIDESYIKDYEKLYNDAKEHPEAFWENIARDYAEGCKNNPRWTLKEKKELLGKLLFAEPIVVCNVKQSKV